MYFLPVFVLLLSYVGCSIGDPICGQNEYYDPCGSLCQSTCQNRQFGHCGSDCEAGCYCKPNYVKDEFSKSCVLVRNCPKY